MDNSNNLHNSNHQRPGTRPHSVNTGQNEANSNNQSINAANTVDRPGDQDDDVESLSEQLSPTDGYFNNGRSPIVPPNLMIPDPNQQGAAEASKAREAREEVERERVRERQGHATSGVGRGGTGGGNGASNTVAASGEERRISHAPQPSFSLGRRRFGVDEDDDDADDHGSYTERTPLLNQAPLPPTNAPPPAYSYATAGSAPYRSPTMASFHNRSMSQASRDSGYNTMSGRQELFSGNRSPQDLWEREEEGGDPDDWWWGFRKDVSGWRGWVRRMCKPQSLIIAIVVLIGVGFLASVIMNITKAIKRGHSGVDLPGEDDTPNRDIFKSCPAGVLKYSESFPFSDSSSFQFLHLVRGSQSGLKGQHGVEESQHDVQWTAVQTSGEVNVWPAKDETTEDIQMQVKLHYSHHAIMRDTSIDGQSEKLHVYTPGHITLNQYSTQRPCIYVEAHIWIRPLLKLEHLALETETLAMIMHENLDFDSHQIRFGSISGSVAWPPGNSLPLKGEHKGIVVSTVSGSVIGTFPLFDNLQIASHAGSVNINLDPREGNFYSGLLEITTTSGSVKINTPAIATSQSRNFVPKIPERDYRSWVNSSSGSLRLNLLHRSETRLATLSGSIHVTLTPHGCSTCPSIIDTETTSGSTTINVHSFLSSSSYSSSPEPLKNLNGDYKFETGSLRISYPREWEGKISGDFMTASLSRKWSGLRNERIDKSGFPAVTRYQAEVGNGWGQLVFHGLSGSVRLRGDGVDEGGNGGSDDWFGGGNDDILDPVEIPVDEPREPGEGEDWSGGVLPPPRWPGYEDEWGFQRGH